MPPRKTGPTTSASFKVSGSFWRLRGGGPSRHRRNVSHCAVFSQRSAVLRATRKSDASAPACSKASTKAENGCEERDPFLSSQRITSWTEGRLGCCNTPPLGAADIDGVAPSWSR